MKSEIKVPLFSWVSPAWKIGLGLCFDVLSGFGQGFFIGGACLWVLGRLIPSWQINSPSRLDDLTTSELAKLPTVFGQPLPGVLIATVLPLAFCVGGTWALVATSNRLQVSPDPKLWRLQRRILWSLAAGVGGLVGVIAAGWITSVLIQPDWNREGFSGQIPMLVFSWLTGAACGISWVIPKLKRLELNPR